ncbi:MAG TPA: PadR family transcriptional regulator [Candidatus Nitrosotalea sp.]|nr:PadR family transcriptional regulator [Candidatus Nitrosotalea sp.]
MIKQKGMKVGAVSLWLLLLLAERPMYGYEIIKELEKKFSGSWKPKTGTIYPALEKLEKSKSVTSKVEFMDKAPDRKHYAITEKGQNELAESMIHWSKMAEIIENHWETHQAVFRHKSEITKDDLAKVFTNIAKSLQNTSSFEMNKIIPSAKKFSVKNPTEPLEFKFLYAKEKSKEGHDKFEIHLELEWNSKPSKRDID